MSNVFDDANLPKGRLARTAYVVGSLLIAGLALVAIWGSTLLLWARLAVPE